MRASLRLSAVGLLFTLLAGCDAAEQTAQKLAEKAEQAVRDVAREAVDGTLKALNEQVDEVQQSVNELLGKPADELQKDESQQPDTPAGKVVEPVDAGGIET